MTPWLRAVSSASVLLCFTAAATLPAQADTLGKIGGAVKGAGNAIKKGAQNTGKAIVKGAENTGEAIERGIERTGDAISGKSADEQGELVQVPPPDTPRYVFVQQAGEARTEGDYIILSGLTPSTYYFTDQPIRSAGHMRHSDFAALWQDESDGSFRTSPPSAVLTTPDQIDDDPIVMELLEAAYEDTELSFKFQMVSGNLPQKADDVAIFIDTNIWSAVNLAANSNH